MLAAKKTAATATAAATRTLAQVSRSRTDSSPSRTSTVEATPAMAVTPASHFSARPRTVSSLGRFVAVDEGERLPVGFDDQASVGGDPVPGGGHVLLRRRVSDQRRPQPRGFFSSGWPLCR